VLAFDELEQRFADADDHGVPSACAVLSEQTAAAAIGERLNEIRPQGECAIIAFERLRMALAINRSASPSRPRDSLIIPNICKASKWSGLTARMAGRKRIVGAASARAFHCSNREGFA
jgi:hypothetical protein